MVDEAQDNEEGEHIGVYILSSTRASSEGERRGICTLYATRTPCVHATSRYTVYPCTHGVCGYTPTLSSTCQSEKRGGGNEEGEMRGNGAHP